MARSRPRPSSIAVSDRMRRVPRRDTGPELALRSRLHRLGLRYRVDWPVPGTRTRPDIAFTRAKVAVFIHGCYWHGCEQHGPVPSSNRVWWIAKFEENRARDARNCVQLEAAGWKVITSWEHDDLEESVAQVIAALRASGPRPRSPLSAKPAAPGWALTAIAGIVRTTRGASTSAADRAPGRGPVLRALDQPIDGQPGGHVMSTPASAQMSGHTRSGSCSMSKTAVTKLLPAAGRCNTGKDAQNPRELVACRTVVTVRPSPPRWHQ